MKIAIRHISKATGIFETAQCPISLQLKQIAQRLEDLLAQMEMPPISHPTMIFQLKLQKYEEIENPMV